MTDVWMVLAGLWAVLVLAGVWTAVWWLARLDLQVTVQAAAPVVVPAPKVEVLPRMRQGGPPVRIECRSGSGRRLLEAIEVPARERVPQVTGLHGIYQASHQLADGTWVYRRTGVPRAVA